MTTAARNCSLSFSLSLGQIKLLFTNKFFCIRFGPSIDIVLIFQYKRDLKTNYLNFEENHVFLLKQENYPIHSVNDTN